MADSASNDNLFGFRYPDNNSDCSETAVSKKVESLGNVIGFGVTKVRQFPELIHEQAAEIRSRFTVIRGRAFDNVKYRTGNLLQYAEQQAQCARDRTRQLAMKDPIRFIAGAAAAGAVLGFMIRFWRGRD